ncbi:GlcG/HbpS family heme-binding protein [Paraburkholderia bannensis]|uniref:GlcG/HbpS family heme-binding protein n=1 Tax=Paraburkholderia bannensis TaxID=765414 RepID=UPI002AB67F8E|nr:heme-binding protein [Paraburkholderia bannensis]
MKQSRPFARLRIFAAATAATACITHAYADETTPVPANLSLARAHELIDAATRSAKALGAPVCIAIADAGGTLLAFDRMDGAAPGCTASAIGKAHASAIYRAPTGVFMDMVNGGQPAVAALPELIAIGGGIPVVKDGQFFGAVGVAGSTIQNEVDIAKRASGAFSR